MNTLQEEFKDLCFKYLYEFNKKHELEMTERELKSCWIANEVGGIADLNDMYINFDDIRYDIDNDIPGDKIFDWYWNSVEHAEMGVKYMNFESYCKGAPDPVPPSEFEHIKELRKKLIEIHQEFLDSIDEYKDKNIESF